MEQSRIDWPSFVTCVAIVLLVCLPLAAFPEAGGALLQTVYAFIARELGILYILAGVSCIGFLIWLSLGRFGQVCLGDSDEGPEFRFTSWMAMLFCAGIGAGLMYWCGIEWAYYYQSPPFGVEPRSVEAAEWASTYGMYHWGFAAWAFYCLSTIAIAYPYYVNKIPFLRFSNSCHYFLVGREYGFLSRLIDFLFMIAILGGAGTSLGFSTPMIAACLSRLFGIDYSFTLEVFVVGICVTLFAGSVWLGLKKGIKKLSDIDLVLTFSCSASSCWPGRRYFCSRRVSMPSD